MKIRTRFGIRLNIPFLRNLATFVLHLTEPQFEKLQEHVASIQGIIILAGKPEWASMLFAETS